MSDLYVLQNNLGLIKIGQSSNVQTRLRRIETDDICSVKIVAVREGKGHLEQAKLDKLREHNLIGEWHDGDDYARLDVARVIPLHRGEKWPFPLADDDLIKAWIAHVEQNRKFISAQKLYQRCIVNMERSDPNLAGSFIVGKIWELIHRYELREDWLYYVREGPNGEEILLSSKGIQIPPYTTDIGAALALWPEEERPALWDGEAWDCCIAALKARRRRWIVRKSIELNTLKKTYAAETSRVSR